MRKPWLRPAAMRAPASAAALELGLLGQMLGRNDATAILRAVASNASDLIVAGRALHALRLFDDANEVLRNAVAKAPKDPEANTAWGELYLDAHQDSDAFELFQAALEGDPKWTPALLGGARALADSDPPQAIAVAKKALEINPSYVDAYVFVASQAMDQDHKDEARQLLQKALAINPSSPDVHAGLAAIAFVEDKTAEFEAEVAKALAVSANVRRGVPRGRLSWPRTTTGSTRRRPGASRPGAPAAESADALGPRHAPAAHRRRAGRARRARSLVQDVSP